MQIRPATGQDLDVFVDTLHAAFGLFPEPPVDGGGLWWSALETDRCLLAFTADGRPVGTAATYSFELTLPGGTVVPAGGLTAVGVLPTHRRQGVLSAMMRQQLADLRARGESVGVLLSSEAPIYGRFGYGPATYTSKLTLTRREAALALPGRAVRPPRRRPARSRYCAGTGAVTSRRRSTTGTGAPSPARSPGRISGGSCARARRPSPRPSATSPSTGTPTAPRTATPVTRSSRAP